MNTDLIIIGSGPGGYKAAEYAAKRGLEVVVVERGEAGGTCLNCGCIPTKTLARHAEIAGALKDADDYGIADLQWRLDFGKVMERKQKVVEQLRSGVEYILSQPHITLVRGHASFKDAHTVTVAGTDGGSAEPAVGEYTARHIIIATGAAPKLLHIPGIGSTKVVTSEALLSITSIPRRLCIVGAGVVGMEFASIFNAFGTEVTVVEFLDECLSMADADFAKRLRTLLKRRGVTFHLQAKVKAITGEGVVFERKGKEQTTEADMVLMATGREPMLEGLNLEAAGVHYGRQGIAVNGQMQTSAAHIYAIGDVTDRSLQLAHTATAEGIRAVNHLMGRSGGPCLEVVPAAVFTHPELAFVGMNRSKCQSAGIAYHSATVYYRANGRAQALGDTDGLLELLCDEAGWLIGCTALGSHAADIVQEAGALMCRKTTAGELCNMIHLHPAVNELLVDAAEKLVEAIGSPTDTV
jgi:dihydrolipoamide dehydrogenase